MLVVIGQCVEHNSTVIPNSVFLRHMKTPCMSLFKIKRKLKVKAGIHNFLVNTLIENDHLGPVVLSLVSANRWLRGIKTYRFPWYLTLVSANHASSNPGLGDSCPEKVCCWRLTF